MNKLKFIATLIIINIVFSETGISQNTNITILSSEDSLYIEGVNLFSESFIKEFYTNKKGLVKININKTETFKAFKEGYFSKTFKVFPDKNSVIYLTPFNFNLKTVTIEDKYKKGGIKSTHLRKVEDMFVYHAKKSERIKVGDVDANLATNNVRQIYNKIAGLNSFETSSNGLGTEISVRGLSPERSANLNIRQNGYDISADALGYPDAYYTPPSHSIDIIEVVRGAGVLQYGTQFGGMINYRLKRCHFNKNKVEFESIKTLGSNRYNNSYNALYGKYNKFNFYSFFSYSSGDDWKKNSAFKSRNLFFQGEYQFNNKWSMNLEFMHYYYLAKQPGGLTDALFNNDPSQSIRNRNWFKVTWNVPSVSFKWEKDSKTELESKFFGLFANRKALGFLGDISRADLLENRDLLTDNYLNIGNETKLLKRYTLFKNDNIAVLGVRLYRGNTQKEQGKGDSLSEANFTYNFPEKLEGSSYKFPNYNLALFGENIFYISKKMSLVIGTRAEKIVTNANGYYRKTYSDLAGTIIFDTILYENKNSDRSFLLFSTGYSFQINEKIQLYANLSQNYRAINFNDLRIVNSNFRVDPNLKDETGYNADLGIRGIIKNVFAYDFSLFYLKYNNRIGFVLKTDPNIFNTYRYRTNISKSRNIGFESILELDFLKLFKKIPTQYSLTYFLNTSYVDARYINSSEPAFEDKKVEFVPNFLLKTGVSSTIKNFSFSLQYSFTGEQFSDATNSVYTPNAISGIIPSYYLMDFSMSYLWKKIKLQASINNLTNNIYFSRRTAGYPGPGIIASPPRMFYFSLGFKL